MRIVKPSVELLAITPNADLLIEASGRVCWKSEDRICDGSAETFIKGTILPKHHLSVIEHASATFRIVCDRGVSHELVRHRLASFSQESTRYCNYTKDKFGNEIAIVNPPEGTLTEAQLLRRYNLIRHMEEVYFAEINEGVKAQIARGNLPTYLKTEMVMTANFREWLHVIDLRTSAAAHPQAREIVSAIADILARECPVIFAGASH